MRTTGKQCGFAATGVYQPSLRSPWLAAEVNQVWNLANEASYEAWHVPVPEVGYIQGVWRSAFADLPEVKTAVAASIGGEQMALF